MIKPKLRLTDKLALLVACFLLLAVPAYAAITIANNTKWVQNMENPDIVKQAGADAVAPYASVTTEGQYVRIDFKSYVGDQIVYDEILKVVNTSATKSYSVKLQGLSTSTGPNISKMLMRIYLDGASGYVEYDHSATPTVGYESTGNVTIAAGGSNFKGVKLEVTVDPGTTPDGSQVDTTMFLDVVSNPV